MTKPVILVGEAKGANEAKINSSFVGASGIELLKMLNEASIITLTAEDRAYLNRFWDTADPNMIDMIWRMHPEVYRTNVFNLHPPANDITTLCGPKSEAIPGYPSLIKSKFVRREFVPHLERLNNEILSIDPNIIIALGNTPLWALCGTTGISKIRGTTRLSTHTSKGFKVISTYHPAAVLRQWDLRPVTITDFMKARRESAFREVRRPTREIWIEPSLKDLEEFYEKHIVGCGMLAVDIETTGNQITCIGFSPSPAVAIVIPIFDSRRKDGSYFENRSDELQAWKFIIRILGDRGIKKVFQNGLYDISFLWRSVGVKVYGAEHDTMLLHHALQPESLKSLGFLGSIYSDEGPWKTERRGDTTIKRDA